jgi:hypothetical protein
MQANEAADLIKTIADSLRKNPQQFHLNVTVNSTGFSAQNTGGIGFLAQNTGGVGFNSSIGNANIQIAQQQGVAAADQALTKLLEHLQEMDSLLRQQAPNKGRLQSLADSVFADKWVPGVISAVVMSILKMVGL